MVVPAAPLLPIVDVANLSDPGRDPNKQVNEDSCGYLPTRFGHLLIVCDGMGGHAGGQQASQLAVATVARALETFGTEKGPGLALKEAIVQAGAAVFQMGGNQPSTCRPGSTCVSMLVHNGGTEIAHVGDSRAYLIRGKQIWQLTRDHSVVQQMIDHGVLTPEAARLRPDANVITRALGMRVDTEVELRDTPFPHETGDVYVLASDGLCDVVPPEDIVAYVLQSPTLEQACSTLVELANSRGGPDNITVQLARVRSNANLDAGTRITEVLNPPPRNTEVLEPIRNIAFVEPIRNEAAGRDGMLPDMPSANKAAPLPMRDPPARTLMDTTGPGAPGPTLIEQPSNARPSPHPGGPHMATTPLFGMQGPGVGNMQPGMGPAQPGMGPAQPGMGPAQPGMGPASSRNMRPLPSLDPNVARRPMGPEGSMAAPPSWADHNRESTPHERTQRRLILLLLFGCVLLLAILAGLVAWWFLTK